MGNNQTTSHRSLPTEHASFSNSSREYANQYIMIAGGPSVVIYQGLVDQIISIENRIENAANYEKVKSECLKGIHQRLVKYFPVHFHDTVSEKIEEQLVDLWHSPNFKEEYFANRFQVDPYLVLPTVFNNLERGIKFNLKRTCLFQPAGRQYYFTTCYSKTTDNFPHSRNQKLTFELFANCFSADTWADVVGASFSLSDYDNNQYLDEFYQVCRRLSGFSTYRMILIFTHLDVLNEKIKLGLINFGGDKDIEIRKEFNHIPKECALIIEYLIKEAIKNIEMNPSHDFPNRTLEYHIVNTSSDSDMKELLDCICIGANSKRKCFISSKIEMPPFSYPNTRFKSNMHRTSELNQFCDIAILLN
ncbi:predicted protein [Naegleria gruberi]|uniref:Predicted protein n=1 Tax=Naegleria gruberi TaxID=5762 RepID=D2W4Z1_NAEGR|nr:uncharacterized protein NAEGRDRAFT_54707 [Naegleria gruberi]EFC35863.1 predicted protein [Naegleria gruberi]|eukprot:XP_002668607.1 predicted protein [Naegleria gruberi strain NEG-M]